MCQAAYKRLALMLHPDKVYTPQLKEVASRVVVSVKQGLEKIDTAEKRQQYDWTTHSSAGGRGFADPYNPASDDDDDDDDECGHDFGDFEDMDEEE
jgi:DnaJ-class molecular chaperone